MTVPFYPTNDLVQVLEETTNLLRMDTKVIKDFLLRI